MITRDISLIIYKFSVISTGKNLIFLARLSTLKEWPVAILLLRKLINFLSEKKVRLRSAHLLRIFLSDKKSVNQ